MWGRVWGGGSCQDGRWAPLAVLQEGALGPARGLELTPPLSGHSLGESFSSVPWLCWGGREGVCSLACAAVVVTRSPPAPASRGQDLSVAEEPDQLARGHSRPFWPPAPGAGQATGKQRAKQRARPTLVPAFTPMLPPGASRAEGVLRAWGPFLCGRTRPTPRQRPPSLRLPPSAQQVGGEGGARGSQDHCLQGTPPCVLRGALSVVSLRKV